MKSITQSDIATAAKAPATKRELCGIVAANLAEHSPGMKFAWSDAGVFLMREGGAIVMLYSWTLFGGFVRCAPALDVTKYTDRSELSTTGPKA